jgi:hypothetical protein
MKENSPKNEIKREREREKERERTREKETGTSTRHKGLLRIEKILAFN